MNGSQDVIDAVREHEAGDEVTVTFERDGEIQSLVVRLGSRGRHHHDHHRRLIRRRPTRPRRPSLGPSDRPARSAGQRGGAVGGRVHGEDDLADRAAVAEQVVGRPDVLERVDVADRRADLVLLGVVDEAVPDVGSALEGEVVDVEPPTLIERWNRLSGCSRGITLA